jgi:uncharacterized protein (DUF302 family)
MHPRSKLFVAAVALAFLAAGAAASAPALAQGSGEGLIVKPSAFGATKTLDRLAIALKRAGLTIFARVKHQAGAKKVGLDLRPTELLIFGNPKMGTPLMQANQAMGLDLPLRAVAWEDKDGKGHLAYTDPSALKARYGITGKDALFAKMTGALKKFTDMATTKGALPKK